MSLSLNSIDGRTVNMEISTELEDDFVNTVDSSGADDIDALGLEVANYLINLESVNVVAKKSMVRLSQVPGCVVDLAKTFILFQVVSTILQKKGLYQLALEKASELISDAYGYALKEAKDGKEVLIFLVAPVSMSNADYIPEEVQKMKNLLMIILGYIYLKGGRASETALVGFLNKLDIDVPEDEYFGNVNDLLHSFFTMQYYLKRQKETEKTTGDVK